MQSRVTFICNAFYIVSPVPFFVFFKDSRSLVSFLTLSHPAGSLLFCLPPSFSLPYLAGYFFIPVFLSCQILVSVSSGRSHEDFSLLYFFCSQIPVSVLSSRIQDDLSLSQQVKLVTHRQGRGHHTY